MIERTHYWYQHGSLYTPSKDCGEALYNNLAYDLLEAVESDEFAEQTDTSYDSI